MRNNIVLERIPRFDKQEFRHVCFLSFQGQAPRPGFIIGARLGGSPLRNLLFFSSISQRLLGMVRRRCYQFGSFRLDAAGRALLRDGKRVALTPKAVDVLIVLVEARDHPVGKEELLRKVWANTVVEEGSLTSHISLLRKALGENNGR